MSTDLITLIIGAFFNLVVALLIVRGIYYPVTQNKNYVFSFLAFNTVIYFVLGLLNSVELSIGVGFGLFAIFSVLRYRTEEMPSREMTYLFTVIALPVMNSILISMNEWPKVLFANLMVVVVLFVLERGWGFRFLARHLVVYERIDLIVPAKRAEMIADLRQRTGLPVKQVEIGNIDLLRDVAQVTVFYDEKELNSPTNR
jgi:hypothetical protein